MSPMNMNKLLTILMMSMLGTVTTVRTYAEAPSDFTVVSSTDGSKFTLSDHRGKTVVLHFLLKTECPYCLRYTRDYAVLSKKTPDIVHVFLKPDSDEDIKAWVSHLDAKDLQTLPQIYRDADAELAKRFEIPGGYQFHGQRVHYPALIAIDGKGQEIFRYVGKSNSDRLAAKDFAAKLASKQQ